MIKDMIIKVKVKRLAIAAAGVFLFLFLTGCQQSSSGSSDKYISASNFQLDTMVTVDIYDSEDESIFEDVFVEIDRLEKLLSVDYAGSDLDRLAKNSGKDFIEVSPETIFLLEESKKYCRLSQGAFDVTTGPLISLWDIRDGQGHVPSQEELEDVFPLINGENILIDSANNKAMLKNPGMKANLGAIAKGYIADKAKEVLQNKGIKSAIVNLGGNVVLVGGKPNGEPFRVGIQDPLQATGDYLGIVDMADRSLVSSGSYERYFEYEGKTYHHILDPDTGFPVENELLQVTIISNESVDGDALSTTAFLLGLSRGLALIDSMPEVSAVFITNDKKVYLSQDIGKGFLLTNNNYTLMK